ncbi:MAG: hypothetical protein AB2693_30750 [Candidatus Thiodiazotropha sp.]
MGSEKNGAYISQEPPSSRRRACAGLDPVTGSKMLDGDGIPGFRPAPE